MAKHLKHLEIWGWWRKLYSSKRLKQMAALLIRKMFGGQESYFTGHSCVTVCSGITLEENQQSLALLWLNSLTILLNTAQYHVIHIEKKSWNKPDCSLCVGKPPVTGWFPSQRVSNASSGNIWVLICRPKPVKQFPPTYRVCGIKRCHSIIPLTYGKQHMHKVWRGFFPCTPSLQWNNTIKFCGALSLVY